MAPGQSNIPGGDKPNEPTRLETDEADLVNGEATTVKKGTKQDDVTRGVENSRGELENDASESGNSKETTTESPVHVDTEAQTKASSKIFSTAVESDETYEMPLAYSGPSETITENDEGNASLHSGQQSSIVDTHVDVQALLLSLPIDSLHSIASFLSPLDWARFGGCSKGSCRTSREIFRRVRMHGFRCATEVVTAWVSCCNTSTNQKRPALTFFGHTFVSETWTACGCKRALCHVH